VIRRSLLSNPKDFMSPSLQHIRESRGDLLSEPGRPWGVLNKRGVKGRLKDQFLVFKMKGKKSQNRFTAKTVIQKCRKQALQCSPSRFIRVRFTGTRGPENVRWGQGNRNGNRTRKKTSNPLLEKKKTGLEHHSG